MPFAFPSESVFAFAGIRTQAHVANPERELHWAQLKIQSLEDHWRQHLIQL